MNNDELDQLLKSAPVPERPTEYWREFPRRITAKLHWQTAAGEHERSDGPARKYDYKFAWGWIGAIATVFVAIGLLVKFHAPHHAEIAKGGDSSDLTQARKCYSELEALFPNQLRGIVFDEHGPRMMLAEQAVVPDSTPFYLKICTATGCQSVVTFSGQRIQVAGESCEVLADARGQVMLVGNDHVWQQNSKVDSVHVQATPLSASL